MPSLLETVELYLKNNHTEYLKILIKMYGVKLRVFQKKQNKFTKVYGKQAGGSNNLPDEDLLEALVISADLVQTTGSSSGVFDEGFLYTNDSRDLVGTEVEVVRKDNLQRRYRVESSLAEGMTTTVFQRYRLASMTS